MKLYTKDNQLVFTPIEDENTKEHFLMKLQEENKNIREEDIQVKNIDDIECYYVDISQLITNEDIKKSLIKESISQENKLLETFLFSQLRIFNEESKFNIVNFILINFKILKKNDREVSRDVIHQSLIDNSDGQEIYSKNISKIASTIVDFIQQ